MTSESAAAVANSASAKREVEVSVRTSYDPETHILSIWAHRVSAGPGEIEVVCQEKWGAIFVEYLTIEANQLDSPVQVREFHFPWDSYFTIISISPSEDTWNRYVVAPENKN